MRAKNTSMCRCGSGTVLTGQQRQYNAKSKKDNAYICVKCALEELYDLLNK